MLDANNLQRLNTLAAHVCKRIKKYWSGKKKEHSNLAALAAGFGPDPTKKVQEVKKMLAPEFFKVEVSRLRNVANKGWKKKNPPPEWCSRDFVLQVFNGPVDEAKNPDLKMNLRAQINLLLPGYGKFLGAGFNVDSLMADNNNVADLCFLEAVWRYTNCVGLDKFPCGLAKWPPEEEPGQKKIKEESSDKSKAAGGSCTFSAGCAASCPGCPSCKG